MYISKWHLVYDNKRIDKISSRRAISFAQAGQSVDFSFNICNYLSPDQEIFHNACMVYI